MAMDLSPTAATRQASPASLFHCSECRGDIEFAGSAGACVHCHHPFAVFGDRIVDFLGEPSPSALAMASWPRDLAERLGPALEAAASGVPIAAKVQDELEGLGLSGPDRTLTALGRKIRYQLLEYEWQAGDDQFQSYLDLGDVGANSRVLDIGCGAGQTLRLLADRSPSLRVGIDYDAEVLTLGQLTSHEEGQPIVFGRATAHALPFLDGQFTHVVCRVALNYMHQKQALAEMVRVLEPGGFLFTRTERVWYDLRLLGNARGIREAICRVRDLGYGLIHVATGWQPMPGRRSSGGRIFATFGGLSRRLKRSGLEVLKVEGSARCPRFFGLSTQGILLARRRPGQGSRTGRMRS